MKFSWLTIAAAAFVCCACASVPVRYYSLTPASKSPSQTAAAVCCSVDLKKVTIPAEVDRAELVARRSDAELDVLSNDLWLAPLADEIKSALLDGIRHVLSTVAIPEATPTLHRFTVAVNVERFESVVAGHVLVQAYWRIESSGETKSVAAPVCEATVNVAVTEGIPALVLGQQQAIAAFAERIAMNINQLRRAEVATCAG